MSGGISAVFLDRDGVLTHEGGEYVTSPSSLRLLPGAAQAVRELTRAGLRVFVATNQAGVARGAITPDALSEIHSVLVSRLRRAGGVVEQVYVCPHAPEDRCECRKPLPGLLLRAAREHGIDLSRAWMVGDSDRDRQAGAAAGCRTITVLTGHTTALPDGNGSPLPDAIARDLASAVGWLLSPAAAAGGATTRTQLPAARTG